MYFMSVNRIKPDADRARIGEIIPPHIAWLNERIAEGSVLQSGKWGDIGGMVIIRASDLAEADRLLQNDPLVRSGLITWELAPFYPQVEF